jgi:hypothetical protein
MQALMAIRQIIGKRIVFDCTETIDSATLRLCDSHRSSRYKMQQNDFIAHDQGRALHAGGATGAALRPEGGLDRRTAAQKRALTSARSGIDWRAAVDEDGQYCFAVAL